jgi:DNA modification methylase
MNYQEFLQSKITIAERSGFEVDPAHLHHENKPHQSDAIRWAASLGRALIAMSFGLGKTRIQCELARLIHERTGKPVLVICPLGVKHQFTEEDGPRLGVRWQYVRNDAEAFAAGTPYLITNYERVRDGNLTAAVIDAIAAVFLDEGSILRSLGSKTADVFKQVFGRVPYRYVCTATPAPNEFKELIYYAEFLGIMDHGQALTRFFKRDSEHAGHLTLMPSQEENFWMWCASWALFLTKPSDLGYSDAGYDLPALRVHWHRLSVDHTRAWGQTDDRGQRKLILDATGGVSEASAEKKATLPDRMLKMREILAEHPDRHWILWHHLETERAAIEREIPEAVTVYGSQDLEVREQRIIDFSRGKVPILAVKPEIAGSGCNFQRYCFSNIYLGIDYKFQDFIQSIHRTQRFLQTHDVDVHIIYAESEDGVVSVLKRKWAQHEQLMGKMQAIIRQYGLSAAAIQAGLSRKIGVDRMEVKGELYTAVNADCVDEVRRLPDNAMGLWVTSIPFGNHYEYSIQYEDFGHNPSDAHFWQQMDFLIPEMLRTLQPGRVAAIHVKDRQLYGHQTQSGIMETAPFSDECVMAFRKHGFTYQGRRTIVTDVVRENNSTYRLSYGEMLKDASKMSSGLPEYLLLFRKPPTTRENARADIPVTKQRPQEFTVCADCGYALTADDQDLEMEAEGDPLFSAGSITAICPNCHKRTEFRTGSEGGYSLGRWQIDAHAFWRSNGNRPLTPAELVGKYPMPEQIADLFKAEQLSGRYDYERHVQVCEELEKRGRLPKFFMLLPPRITRDASDMVWDDVVYMRTLNTAQSQGRREKHLCPLPFDIVERSIRLYSNEGDLVGDPFGGLGTVPERAVRLGRRAWTSELNRDYFTDLTHYCQAAEQDVLSPTLFSMIEFQERVKV